MKMIKRITPESLMEDRDQLMMVSGNLGLLKTLEPNHNRDHSRVKLIIKYLQCIPISK